MVVEVTRRILSCCKRMKFPVWGTRGGLRFHAGAATPASYHNGNSQMSDHQFKPGEESGDIYDLREEPAAPTFPAKDHPPPLGHWSNLAKRTLRVGIGGRGRVKTRNTIDCAFSSSAGGG